MSDNQKIHKLVFSITLAIILLTAWSSISASVFKVEDKINISNLQQIDDDLYAVCNELIVDGAVNGDVIAISSDVDIHGPVTGSGMVASNNFKQHGKIDGSIRFAGQIIDIYGIIGRSVDGIGTSFKLHNGALVHNGVHFMGESATIDGIIQGDLYLKADNVYITGTIEGNVTIKAKKITIDPPAVIGGNLTYTSENEAVIQVDSGVTIVGETTWKEPEVKETGWIEYSDIILRFSFMLAAFLFGILSLWLFKPYCQEAYNQLVNRTAVSLAAGLLMVIVFLFCLVLLAFSLFAVILGMILISQNTATFGALLLIIFTLTIPISSFASVSGGILFYTGKILLAFFIGNLVLLRIKSNRNVPSKLPLLLGLIILMLAFSIPYLGRIIYIGAGILGAGSILLGIRFCQRQKTLEINREKSDQPPIAENQ